MLGAMGTSGEGAREEWGPEAGMGSPQVFTPQVHKWVWLHVLALPTSQVSDDPRTNTEC